MADMADIFNLFCKHIEILFFPTACGGQSCISVCPVTLRCSVSVGECGPSVLTCRNSLPRWSRTDLSRADKRYRVVSSCTFAGILLLALHKSATFQKEGVRLSIRSRICFTLMISF